MDYSKLEAKCKRIVELRQKRNVLQTEINSLTKEVTAELESQNNNRLKMGDLTIELVKKIRRDLDFNFLDELQAKGLLPVTKMSKSYYTRLLITTADSIQLVGNKFIVGKK